MVFAGLGASALAAAALQDASLAFAAASSASSLACLALRFLLPRTMVGTSASKGGMGAGAV